MRSPDSTSAGHVVATRSGTHRRDQGGPMRAAAPPRARFGAYRRRRRATRTRPRASCSARSSHAASVTAECCRRGWGRVTRALEGTTGRRGRRHRWVCGRERNGRRCSWATSDTDEHLREECPQPDDGAFRRCAESVSVLLSTTGHLRGVHRGVPNVCRRRAQRPPLTRQCERTNQASYSQPRDEFLTAADGFDHEHRAERVGSIRPAAAGVTQLGQALS
jgi:hypothetical protein